MQRLLWFFAAVASPLLFSSCGVYQMVTDTSPDHDAAANLVYVPLLITGDWPSTESSDPLMSDAREIKRRNIGSVTPERAQWIHAAMRRCFQNAQIRKMSRPDLVSLFGVPDATTTDFGREVLIYRFKNGQYSEGRLVRS
jgi:hypothetical protein